MPMSRILLNQLRELKTAHFKIVGGNEKDFSEPFDEVIFYKKEQQEVKTKISLADYIIKPFKVFDFHDKWNNGTPPPCKVMYGCIDNETKGMYHFSGKNDSGNLEWSGWVPKKSCVVEEVKI